VVCDIRATGAQGLQTSARIFFLFWRHDPYVRKNLSYWSTRSRTTAANQELAKNNEATAALPVMDKVSKNLQGFSCWYGDTIPMSGKTWATGARGLRPPLQTRSRGKTMKLQQLCR